MPRTVLVCCSIYRNRRPISETNIRTSEDFRGRAAAAGSRDELLNYIILLLTVIRRSVNCRATVKKNIIISYCCRR
jgi:hypothetical protein